MLNSPVMNAFAVPGGYLYVTRQLVGLANDEAELASVLGHEAGHIAARHSSQRKRAGLLSQILAVGLGAVTGSSQLGSLAGQVTQGLVLGYSRRQELEADDLGVRYIAAAGYDPTASASFLGSLGAAASLESRAVGGKDERSTPSWARTHPLSADRVTRATKTASATGRAGTGLRNRDLFLARIDGIMVDDDPKQGVIDGRDLHPSRPQAALRRSRRLRHAERRAGGEHRRPARPGAILRRNVPGRSRRLSAARPSSRSSARRHGSPMPSRGRRRSTACPPPGRPPGSTPSPARSISPSSPIAGIRTPPIISP